VDNGTYSGYGKASPGNGWGEGAKNAWSASSTTSSNGALNASSPNVTTEAAAWLDGATASRENTNHSNIKSEKEENKNAHAEVHGGWSTTRAPSYGRSSLTPQPATAWIDGAAEKSSNTTTKISQRSTNNNNNNNNNNSNNWETFGSSNGWWTNNYNSSYDRKTFTGNWGSTGGTSTSTSVQKTGWAGVGKGERWGYEYGDKSQYSYFWGDESEHGQGGAGAGGSACGSADAGAGYGSSNKNKSGSNSYSWDDNEGKKEAHHLMNRQGYNVRAEAAKDYGGKQQQQQQWAYNKVHHHSPPVHHHTLSGAYTQGVAGTESHSEYTEWYNENSVLPDPYEKYEEESLPDLDLFSTSVPSEVLKPREAANFLKLKKDECSYILRFCEMFLDAKKRSDDLRSKSTSCCVELHDGYTVHVTSRVIRPYRQTLEAYITSSDSLANEVFRKNEHRLAQVQLKVKESQERLVSTWWLEPEKCLHMWEWDPGYAERKWITLEQNPAVYELAEQCKFGKRADVLRALKDLGPRSIDLLKVRDKRGRSVIHYVAIGGNHNVVDCFAPMVNARDSEGWTPLHYAAYLGHRATCEELVKCGAFLETKDDEGYDALHFSQVAGMKQTFTALTELMARPLSRRGSGVVEV